MPALRLKLELTWIVHLVRSSVFHSPKLGTSLCDVRTCARERQVIEQVIVFIHLSLTLDTLVYPVVIEVKIADRLSLTFTLKSRWRTFLEGHCDGWRYHTKLANNSSSYVSWVSFDDSN